MFHRRVFPLALLAALTGCAGAPRSGPLVEYREGITPITRPVPRTASYVLHDGTDALAHLNADRGTRVGFRREPDGSVTAVGPDGFAQPLAPGAYTWTLIPGSVREVPWRERAREYVKLDVRETVEATKNALLMTLLILAVLAFSVAYGMGQANTNRAR